MTKKKNVKKDKVTSKPVSKAAKTTKRKTKSSKDCPDGVCPLDKKIKQKKKELSTNLEQQKVVKRSLCQKVYDYLFPSYDRS